MNVKKISIDYFHRMKYYVLLSLIVFVLSMILSYAYPEFFQSIMNPALDNMKEGVKNGQIVLKTLPLFLNNFNVALNIYCNGLYLSVPSIYILCYNAIVVGYTGATMDLLYFITFTLPHGIFELTAIIFSGAASFRLTHAIINIFAGIRPYDEDRSQIFLEYVQKSMMMIMDSAVLMVITAILLIIAAVIEANITIGLGNYLIGI